MLNFSQTRRFKRMTERFVIKFVSTINAQKASEKCQSRFTRQFLFYFEKRRNLKKMENHEHQGLVKVDETDGKDETYNQYMNDYKGQAQEYGQRLQDAAIKAKDFAGEKFAQAGDKFKELQNKEPQELVEDAKEFARQKPGQALLISAAVGLVIGVL
jgi:ElaB/YqjD/DUF883 family membrane-anchored ribosome-binding protein